MVNPQHFNKLYPRTKIYAGYSCILVNHASPTDFHTPRFYSQETLASNKTFAHQSKLSRLQVPCLKSSLGLYLNAMQHHLNEAQLSKLKFDLDHFLNNQGPVLQKTLLEYSKDKENWLEQIWLNKAYLEPRYPLLLNVNWYLQFAHNPIGLLEPKVKNKPTVHQLLRASVLTNLLLQKNAEINNETLLPDRTKTGAYLCMEQYKKVFGTTRIPRIGKDEIKSSWPTKEKHIILIYKDQLFKVTVYDHHNHLLTPLELYNLFSKAVGDVDLLLAANKLEPQIGVLTSEDRDIWAEARNEMLSVPANRENLEAIEQGLFVVCLDDSSPGLDIDTSHHLLFHNHNARNRWFDKAMQLIVCSDGLCGVNGEHTPSDAIVPGRILHEALLKEPEYTYPEKDMTPVASKYDLTPYVQHLKWKVSSNVQAQINQAMSKAAAATSKINSIFLTFDNYGASAIKNLKASPDAYMQLALQLAYYRMYSKCCHTYETASLRQFLKGRTETARPCTKESLSFCEMFDNKNVTKETKTNALKQAMSTHLKYMKLASSGRAFDRHFLGLKTIAQTNLAFLESDFAQKSFSFDLSTSNMTPGTHVYGGFAPVTPNGYGVNYSINSDTIRISISAWNTSNETSANEFRNILYNSLVDLERFLAQS